MCKWLTVDGVIRTKTIREFVEKYGQGMSYAMAAQLHCGARVRIKGFCSMSPKPKARRLRKRFLTRIVDSRTREEFVLGPSVKEFARSRGLSKQGVYELINGRVTMYRGLVLASTLEAMSFGAPDGNS